jgi:hypothetical protein
MHPTLKKLIDFQNGPTITPNWENAELVLSKQEVADILAWIPDPDPVGDVPYEEIVAAYHKWLPNLPKVSKLTTKRKAQLKARWQEDKQRQTLEWWDEIFHRAANSSFLTGAKTSWRADFDFFLQPSRLLKHAEGGYADVESAAQPAKRWFTDEEMKRQEFEKRL